MPEQIGGYGWMDRRETTMMIEFELVAQGEGWSVYVENDRLRLHVMGPVRLEALQRSVTIESVTIDLPPDFVTEFARHKKALRASEEACSRAKALAVLTAEAPAGTADAAGGDA